MLKGLIFDFDGLILDTETPAYQTWQNIFARYECSLPLNLWQSSIGTAELYFDPLVYLHSISRSAINDMEIVDVYNKLVEELIQKEKILPGIFELIKAARKKHIKFSYSFQFSNQLGKKIFHIFRNT